ncbi:hypothetical protein [Desulfonatronum parangueonense]
MHDLEGRILNTNQAAQGMYGYALDELRTRGHSRSADNDFNANDFPSTSCHESGHPDHACHCLLSSYINLNETLPDVNTLSAPAVNAARDRRTPRLSWSECHACPGRRLFLGLRTTNVGEQPAGCPRPPVRCRGRADC